MSRFGIVFCWPFCQCSLTSSAACGALQEKNKDELLLNLRELMQGSTMPFLTMLFNDDTNPSAIAAAMADGSHETSSGQLVPPPSPGVSPALMSPSKGVPPLVQQASMSSLSAGGFSARAPTDSNKVSQGTQFRNQVSICNILATPCAVWTDDVD
jgi:hypothetical protein